MIFGFLIGVGVMGFAYYKGWLDSWRVWLAGIAGAVATFYADKVEWLSNIADKF
jgi:biotin transporter BioY